MRLRILGRVLVASLLCMSAAACADGPGPDDFVFRARIDDCRITTPQLATVFQVDDRLMVTAAHPFEGIRAFELFDTRGDAVGADLIALKPEKDLAVLRLHEDRAGSGAQFADDAAVADQPVQLAVFDRDGNLELREGIAVRRANVTLDGEDRRQAIELNAEIDAGDSGAPVLAGGNVVGVVFAASRGRESGWAVSLPEVETLLADTSRDAAPLELECPAEG